MKNITLELLLSFSACETGWKNFDKHYPKFDGTFKEVMDLENITYDDKIWLAKKVLNRNQLVHFAILSTESVLHIYENKYPQDARIKGSLNYMKSIVDFSDLSQEQREKLIEYRKSSRSAAATYAAYAAYAAAAADADAYAADAATYAAAYAIDAYADAAARKNQQDLNLQFLKIVADL